MTLKERPIPNWCFFWMMCNISILMRYRSESITSGGMGTAPISHDLRRDNYLIPPSILCFIQRHIDGLQDQIAVLSMIGKGGNTNGQGERTAVAGSYPAPGARHL